MAMSSRVQVACRDKVGLIECNSCQTPEVKPPCTHEARKRQAEESCKPEAGLTAPGDVIRDCRKPEGPARRILCNQQHGPLHLQEFNSALVECLLRLGV